MVVNLIKKDLRDSKQTFIPIFIFVTALLLFMLSSTSITNFMDKAGLDSSTVLFSFMTLSFFPIIISVLFLSINAVSKTLYTNIYNNQGYELFTLPVKSSYIIISKVMTTIIWLVSLLAYSFILLNIIFLITQDILVSDIINSISIFFSMSLNDLIIKVLNTLSSFITVALILLIILFSGAISHTKYISKFKKGVSITLFIVIINVISKFESIFYADYYSAFNILFLENVFAFNSKLNSVFYIIMLIRILIITILFLSTNYLWNNKLQLID